MNSIGTNPVSALPASHGKRRERPDEVFSRLTSQLSQNRSFIETICSVFVAPPRPVPVSTELLLDESQNSSHNQNLKRPGY